MKVLLIFFCLVLFNRFHATGLLLFSLKTSENLWFSVFRGHNMRPETWHGLMEQFSAYKTYLQTLFAENIY